MKRNKNWFAGGSAEWLRGVVFGLCLVGLARASQAPDVAYIFLMKMRNYTQNSADLVRLSMDGDQQPFQFGVEVDPASQGSVVSATVTKPDNSVVSLSMDQWGGGSLRWETQTGVMPDVDAAAVQGSYVIHTSCATWGAQSTTLTLGPDNFSGIPKITNFTAAQTVAATTDFQLTWSGFNGGTASDVIVVEVDDADTGNSVWSTPMPGQSGTLNGTAVSATIPAGTLRTGKDYSVNLTFARPTDQQTASYIQAGAYAVFLSQTKMPLRTTGADTTLPQLVNVVPQYGQYGVERNSAILFRFSETMDTSSVPTTSLVWSGTDVNPSSFSYQWTGDGKALVAKYDGLLPASTAVSWSFVTGTSGHYPKDLAGNKIPLASGSFTTQSDPSSMPPDTNMAVVGKMQMNLQDASGMKSMGAKMLVNGDNTGANTIFAGSVQKTSAPSGSTIGFKASKNDGSLDFNAQYVSKADLDAMVPNGTYTLVLKGIHDGSKTISSLSLDTENYPNVPTCNNLAALQSANPSAAATINWGAFSGAGASDLIVFEIRDAHDNWVYDSQLPATQTSLSVPAGTLSPGRQYNVTLLFARPVTIDTTSYAGVQVMSVWACQTLFRIHTSGTPIMPVVSGHKNPGGNFEGTLQGEKNWRYLVEASDDLSHWIQLQDTWTDGNGGGWMSDPDASFLKRRFYRLKELDPNANVTQMVAIQGQVLNFATNAPIAGAVVSTSLDGSTAVTGADGSFFLITQTPSSGNGSLTYTITVSKSGYQTYSSSGNWGDEPRGQQIHLSP